MWKLLIFTLSLRIKKYFNCMLYFFVSLVLYKYRKKALNKIQQIQLIQIPNFRKTLIFNYSCLPKRQATKIPILIYGNPKFAGLNGNIEIVSAKGKGTKITIVLPFDKRGENHVPAGSDR